MAASPAGQTTWACSVSMGAPSPPRASLFARASPPAASCSAPARFSVRGPPPHPRVPRPVLRMTRQHFVAPLPVECAYAHAHDIQFEADKWTPEITEIFKFECNFKYCKPKKDCRPKKNAITNMQKGSKSTTSNQQKDSEG